MNPYIRIMRPDHWIKQLFILPGSALALLLCNYSQLDDALLILGHIILAVLATSLIASANYVINEWLDREFDKYHPVKKNRPAVVEGLNGKNVYLEWGVLSILGMAVSFFINLPCAITVAALWAMGIVYNVKPVRSKDVAYLDVISESLNNALRLLIGWFAVTALVLPPSSAVLGYWMAGAYLMAIKRFSEYRAINDPERAGLYRRSFRRYTERTLLNSSLFYAMFSVFLLGVFLVKYHIEYIVGMPFLCILYVLYFDMSFAKDSAAQAPEKLFREKKLMLYVVFLIALFVVLTIAEIPVLDALMDTVLVGVA